MVEKDTTKFPPSVERALKVLDYIGTYENTKSIQEIAAELNIPTASTYRIINCLVHYGFLRESRLSADKYCLGYKLYVLGRNVIEGADLCEIAHPHMELLAKSTGQACQLCVISDNAVLTIDQALPLSVITVIAKLGEKIPINVSASGTLLVSLLPADKQKTFLSNAWKIIRKQTPHTIDDLSKYKEKLEYTKIQGYGIDDEEYALSIGCLAVPIFDGKTPIASLGLTGSIDNYRDKRKFQTSLEKLKEASYLISEKLAL
ncbi:MAG: IclR family transcriptional regulator [Flexilinea sp.]